MSAWLSAPGIVCALGAGTEEIHARLHAGDRSGMRPLTGWIDGRAPVLGAYAGDLPDWPETVAPYDRTRNNRLLLAAMQQIEGSLRDAMERYGSHRVGIVVGTSTSGVNDNVAAFRALNASGHWPAGADFRSQVLSSPSAFLAKWLGIGGPSYTISTACTSSARALSSARMLLAMGACDAVVCGGADTLCRLTINGFAALGAIAEAACQPFSVHRNGINIGEAAVLFLMDRTGSACTPVQMLGAGASSDAWHMSAPEPNGVGARLAMEAALRSADLEPADIGWVNLHGTGTLHNDAMESVAMAALFPDRGVPCASTKAMTGHALGAAGALEAALAWMALSPANAEGRLPPHVWDGQPDPQLPALEFSTADHRFPQGARRIVMSNSFAFGGNNASLILGAA